MGGAQRDGDADGQYAEAAEKARRAIVQREIVFMGMRFPNGSARVFVMRPHPNGGYKDGGEGLELNTHLAEVGHSPNGFEWGYGGSGPGQLAYEMAREVVGKKRAREHYLKVCRPLPSHVWTVTGTEIREIIERAERQKKAGL